MGTLEKALETVRAKKQSRKLGRYEVDIVHRIQVRTRSGLLDMHIPQMCTDVNVLYYNILCILYLYSYCLHLSIWASMLSITYTLIHVHTLTYIYIQTYTYIKYTHSPQRGSTRMQCRWCRRDTEAVQRRPCALCKASTSQYSALRDSHSPGPTKR